MTFTVAAYAAQSATSPLAPFSIPRREPGPTDVKIDIQYCGVCHSDLHFVRNEWKFSAYPLVPGHEIVGRVSAVGGKVNKFKVGDVVGVGCMVDSCRTCPSCKEGLENYCEAGSTFTYNGPDKHGTAAMTYGGYSKVMTVDQDFVVKVPGNLDLAGAAPLLCAGITTYSPLRYWGVGKGQRVGIVGLGGLGHMGLKLAHAMGAHVTLFTTSPGKVADANRLGADEIVISRDEKQMEKVGNSLDFVLDTVSMAHDLNPLINALRRDGTLCLVGAPEHPHPPLMVFPMLFKRRSVSASLIGGIKETQEMLDFCGKHNIVSDIEKIPMSGINAAYERMLKSDVKYRFVIDMASI
ncbi:MAG: NAD(P)-dependent alcohol dehydrogenase [Planctomycetes bacterium]|nr:NAD(P)-dependent alcohol dehydrogenase [Planctomycetota bacterium]